MKTKLITLLVLTIFASTYAQFGPQQIITTSGADGATSVYAEDLDGDGDMDVLSASYLDDKIAWYENDGDGNFGSQQIITTDADGANSVYAEDLDGDGDMDVLSASCDDDKIAWYENDGDGNFGPQQIITTNADGATSVYAEDLDGDGDMDVLSASYYDDKIAWYENDGDGNFGSQQIITSNANGAYSVYAEDLDGDGDMDVLSASFNDDKIAWYENEGDGNFGPQQIITTNANEAFQVYAEDLDGDGDNDVLSASQNDDKIAWYENDGDGNFGSQQIITTNTDGAQSVYAEDLDGDGDMDVLSASWYDDKIAWYENLEIADLITTKVVDNASPSEEDTIVYTLTVFNNGAAQATNVSLIDILPTGVTYVSDIPSQGSYNYVSGVWTIGIINNGSNVTLDITVTVDVGTSGNTITNTTSAASGDQYDPTSIGDDLSEAIVIEIILVVNQNNLLDFSVYPNPTTGILNIKSETTIVQIEIHNLLGQLVLSNTNQNTIDISRVSQGVYFIKVKDENGNIGSQKIVKK